MFEVPAGAKGWLVIFHPRSTWWVERLCPGRWKHVSAVGFVPEAMAWVALSWELGRLRVCIVPDEKFLEWFGGWCGEGAGVLRVAAPVFDRGPWRPRLGLFCVSMVAHVLGIRSQAIFPDQLWRFLVAAGAEIAENPASAPGVRRTATRSDQTEQERFEDGFPSDMQDRRLRQARHGVWLVQSALSAVAGTR